MHILSSININLNFMYNEYQRNLHVDIYIYYNKLIQLYILEMFWLMAIKDRQVNI